MSFVRPYAEVEPPENPYRSHGLGLVAFGLMGMLLFNWDQGNMYKNEQKHGITIEEIEAAFANQQAFVYPVPQQRVRRQWSEDEWELDGEVRHLLFCRQSESKYLKIVFTLRTINNQLYIRPISAHYIKEKDVQRKVLQSRYNNHT